ncbi:ferritin-like domain-containing protein [Sphaerospermopsis torques-reginae]|uniref:Ferritin-like protein n=1 Tax=Sphaerospermopsis torques-reginae ITEP-024 TaxID=984208 RepID=A0ABX8WXU6_9CYAN|nr:ferritin-like protein [Sphaerospermopsis torques-reginae]QYX31283.1 ferritin-like protein [Sphaerospermopsis torques-reginae ITEP-024]
MIDTLELITTVEDLHYYLIQGLMIEHATLPPYLTALYSLKPGSNLEAFQFIRTVAVEEMLHLTLVANVFNAVGGDIQGVLTNPDFIPTYPTYLPTREEDFEVSISKFSRETVETFCKIERSHHVDDNKALVESRTRQTRRHNFLKLAGKKDNLSYETIGLFYTEVIRGLKALDKQYKSEGKNLFIGDPKKQITPEYYYDGAGDIVKVTDLDSAIKALYIIQTQGEGSGTKTIYDSEKELSHYYRFQQLLNGRYYVIDKEDPTKSDQPNHPTGETFTVDWDAVYPVMENLTLSKLRNYCDADSELYAHALEFQQAYSRFLAEIEYSFNGHPEQLLPAVGSMFRLKELANSLIRNPIPGLNGVNAGPVYKFE